MAGVSAEQRFRGAVQLVTLHLWRVAKTTDLDACFAEARRRGMIDGDREAFIRECIRGAELLEGGGEFRLGDGDGDGDGEGERLQRAIAELQRCALALNTADPA